jgi:hypothetical protein
MLLLFLLLLEIEMEAVDTSDNNSGRKKTHTQTHTYIHSNSTYLTEERRKIFFDFPFCCDLLTLCGQYRFMSRIYMSIGWLFEFEIRYSARGNEIILVSVIGIIGTNEKIGFGFGTDFGWTNTE